MIIDPAVGGGLQQYDNNWKNSLEVSELGSKQLN